MSYNRRSQFSSPEPGRQQHRRPGAPAPGHPTNPPSPPPAAAAPDGDLRKVGNPPMEQLVFDPLMPGQYFAGCHKPSGERRLAIAIFQDVVDILAKWRQHPTRQHYSTSRLVREAFDWIESSDTAPFTFLNLCALLDLNAARVRAALPRRPAYAAVVAEWARARGGRPFGSGVTARTPLTIPMRRAI